jgi:diaminopimelate epimerase
MALDGMNFSKYHGLGNDYIVIDARGHSLPLTHQIQSICRRNYGVGADGILYGPLASHTGDYRVRIFNPDGSEAEKSGNGLRIFARYLLDQNLAGGGHFSIETKGGVVRCRMDTAGKRIEIDMGRISFRSGEIPVTGPEREVINEKIMAGQREFTFCAATLGNPHCVILVPDTDESLAREYGPQIERHAYFPKRTNVQFVQVVDRQTIVLHIWERGAGYTLASGSSACAASAVAYRLGHCDAQVKARMPGGSLEVEIGRDYEVRLWGPVVRICEGSISAEIMEDS